MATTDLSAYDAKKISSAENFSFGIVTSKWNADITTNLEKGAIETLKKHGVTNKNILKWEVPGSFELIYGTKKMTQKHANLDAIIAIGSVIRGATKHFDFVCHSVSQGIKDLNLSQNIPIIFCVLTDENHRQALERSGGALGNKGVESAVTAIEMANLKEKNS